MLIEVAVSGSIGKQVIPTPLSGGTVGAKTYKCRLESLYLTPSAARATVKIRDGNASGEVVFFGSATTSGGTKSFENLEHNFTKGMHVKVIGTAAVAYLNIE